MGEKRPNYYLILELDLSVRDWPTIEKRIREKRSQWAKDKAQSPVAKRRREADQYLRLIPDMERVLKDDVLRDKERQEAIRTTEKRRQQRLKDLCSDEGEIALLIPRGEVREAELQKLVQECGQDSVSEEDIRKLIPPNIPIRKSERAAPEKKCPPLDPTIGKNIEDELGVLGRNDLYEFLGLSRQASCKSLLHKADEIDREERKKAITPEVSAKLALVAHCKAIFKSADRREGYDRALGERGLRRVTGQIDLLAVDTIDAQTYLHLIRVGMKTGAPKESVERHIRQIGKKRGKAIEVPSTHGEMFRQCGHCRTLNESRDENCRQCGAAMIVQCPIRGCDAQMRNTERCCSRCGFPIGDLPEINRRLADAKARLGADDAEGAARAVAALHQQLLSDWSDYLPLKNLQDRADRVVQEQAEIRTKLRKLVRERRMVEADRVLDASPAGRSSHPELNALRDQIDEALGQAEKEYQLAAWAEAQGDDEGAFGHCAIALAVVADHGRARNLMSKFPPEPPGRIESEAKKMISLAWSPSGSRGTLEYRVVRKPGSAPAGLTDGTLVGTTNAHRLDDDRAEAGVSYYYAVFTIRAGVASRAQHTGPHMCVADVSELAAKPGDGRVSLSWTPPPKATAIEVWRTEGRPPPRRKQDKLLDNVRRGGVTDTDVQNGHTYSYLVVAIFTAEDGTLVASPGQTIDATPAAPPKPVNALSVSRDGSGVSIRWQPPSHGVVEIYRLTDPPPFAAGDHCDINELAALGRKVPSFSDRSAEDDLGSKRVAYYLAVTVAGSVAVIGEGCYVTTVEEVEGLRAAVKGNTMLLKWQWPRGTKTCRVCLRTDEFAGGCDDLQAFKEDVLLTVYESKGGWYMTLPDDATSFYVSVHAALSAGGKTVFADGASAGARTQVLRGDHHGGHRRLRYDIRRPRVRLGKKPHRMLIQGCDCETTLPTLCVVAKSRTVPRQLRDGKTLHAFPAGQVVKPEETLELEFFPSDVPKDALGRLFPANSSDGNWLELIAERARMEL